MKTKDKQNKAISPYTESVISINSKGIGFVASEEFDEDVEISQISLNTALHNDIVKVFIHPKVKGQRPTGEVISIIKRAKDNFVGTIEKRGGIMFFTPDDKRIYTDVIVTSNEMSTQAGIGDKVLLKLHNWQDPKENPQGEIIKIIGPKGDHNVEMQSIIFERGFNADFSKEVEDEAEDIKKRSHQTIKEEIAKRRDFREITTFTIDPETAKDFDDAISIRELEDGNFEIGIHIADPSHYVEIKSAIDKEASERATSVYLVDRTIPMLPEVLSNDLCSLNPDEDKLAFSAIFIMDEDGIIKERWFGETIINSNKRFSYEEAQEILDNKEGLYFKELKILDKISKKLKEKRVEKGSIEFGQDEVRFELDKYGKPLRVYRKKVLETHKLIEDLMLLANREVAEFIYNITKKDETKPFVYRIHDVPDQEKIAELSLYLKTIGHGIKIKDGQITSKDINLLLKKMEGHNEEELVKTAVLRTMAKAIYSTTNIGHYGLAFEYYTHFTSPIRRYPDIMVHRLMKKYLSGKSVSEAELKMHDKLADRSSKREISATDAERASIKYKQIEFLIDKTGKEFDAIITGVTKWGIYVEDKETKAEGMVALRDMKDDYYILDEKNYSLIGEKTKKKYSLGNKVRIKLIKADLDRKTLDFVFV